MSAPPVCVDRWSAQRTSGQPKAAMRCKNCRDSKTQCDRSKPSCSTCQRLSHRCVYDGVRKKRESKEDSVSALLKRIEGLEKRLRDENAKHHDADVPSLSSSTTWSSESTSTKCDSRPASTSRVFEEQYAEILVDTYFKRINGKPFRILDEVSTRRDIKSKTLPRHLCLALFAASVRDTDVFGSREVARRKASEYAKQARANLDIDEPSVDGVQTLLLLSQIMLQEGKTKKSYMYLGSAIAMTSALNLHREDLHSIGIDSADGENRRRVFWACYVMDRFGALNYKRPCLTSDEDIFLQLPRDTDDISTEDSESGSSLAELHFPLLCQSNAGNVRRGKQASLVKIIRILGATHDYLEAGGYHGDMRIPWQPTPRFSKIMSDLEDWSHDVQNEFLSMESDDWDDSMFEGADGTTILICKLVYHLIHCLMYRLALPASLPGLTQHSQEHSQNRIEVGQLCCKHANAITEVVRVAETSGIAHINWPAFMGFCVFTAGTIHLHGMYYEGQAGDAWSDAAKYFAEDIQYLEVASKIWTSVQQQKNTLQRLQVAHSKLFGAHPTTPSCSLPMFETIDFHDRYPEVDIDGSHSALGDHMDPAQHGNARQWLEEAQIQVQQHDVPDLSPEHGTSNQPWGSPGILMPALSPEQWTSNQVLASPSLFAPSSLESSHSSPIELFCEPLDTSSNHQPMIASPSTLQLITGSFWDTQLPDSGITHAWQEILDQETGQKSWATGAAQMCSLQHSVCDSDIPKTRVCDFTPLGFGFFM